MKELQVYTTEGSLTSDLIDRGFDIVEIEGQNCIRVRLPYKEYYHFVPIVDLIAFIEKY